MTYLFDPDAIVELLGPRPLSIYGQWLNQVPREEQFTSDVVIGELYIVVYRSDAQQHHLTNIERRVCLPSQHCHMM